MNAVVGRLKAIVSGGQTGVDRGALDAALAAGFPCGGWCPLGRIAEDGVIAEIYPLKETPVVSYAARTRWNVRDSCATLILTRGPVTGGTALTVRLANELARPVLVVDLNATSAASAVERLLNWLEIERIETLNVAGPRESTTAGIQQQTHAIVTELLRRLRLEERERADQIQFAENGSPSSIGNSGRHSAATQSR